MGSKKALLVYGKNSKMIVEGQRRCIQVHLSPHSEKFQGLEVLKLSTKEQRESRKDLAIKCLRNKVEELNKEHTLRKEVVSVPFGETI